MVHGFNLDLMTSEIKIGPQYGLLSAFHKIEGGGEAEQK